MDIILNGLTIRYIEDEFENILKLECECSHELWQHAFHNMNGLGKIITGQCLYCGVKHKQYICKQFKVYPDGK